ncbi:FKBP-type peptidyl-prolyl cis-trans isomerase [Hyunsoonleella aquatilis]|uniref:FKBP-type peptidyl-prolyl cis-trans isomerase n=1 Tax=Hyunsoonleella aquatilis TaxID=2762758 RepID=UPI001C98F7EA|nr:FKBP-type peptidyl-prolyl cis-trans isomerase [Hyunsoonleella aquatilis]
MKLIKLSIIALVISFASCQNKPGAVSKDALKTEIDSVSYAIGMDVGNSVSSNFENINNDLFIAGYMNVLDSAEVLIDKDEAANIVQGYFQKNREKIMKRQQEIAAKKAEKAFGHIKTEGEEFLKKNVENPDVKTTDSGLQYIVLKEGDGEKPTTADRVKVHYHGTLIDGTVFDSSVDRGTPTDFGVTQVIKGWTEGLQLMNEGAKYKFFIPQELAYGARQSGPNIKPFSMLIFEVELLEILDKK